MMPDEDTHTENRVTPAPLSPTLRGTRLPSEEQRTPEQGNKDYHPLRSGIAASRDPGGCFALVSGEVYRSRLTLLFLAGVSSAPGPVVGGCNPWAGCCVVRSTPGGTLLL